jgi:hypothetical protein
MAVTYGAQGTSSSGTTSCTPSYPTGISASTSEIFAIVTGRSSVANTAFTGPAGWTGLSALESGTGTYGADTGTRRVGFFRKDTVDGTETGTVSFSFAAGTNTSTISATIFRVVKTSGFTVTVEVATGADTTNGTAFSATASSTLDFATGQLMLVGVAQNIDTGTSSARSLTATGVTFGTFGLQVDAAVGNGNDHRRILGTATVTNAATTVAPVYAYTISAAGSGPAAFVLVTETATDTEVALVGSEIDSDAGTLSVPRGNGQSFSAEQGSVSAVGSVVPLTGAEVTTAQGTTSANADGNVALVGQSATASAGTASPGWGQALTGSAAPGSAGSVLVIVNPSTSAGQVITPATGTLVAVGGGDVTVHISGVEFTAVNGSVEVGPSALTGQASTGSAGTAAPSAEVPLTGESMTIAQQSVEAGQEAPDTLIEAESGTAVSNFAVALTGEEATGEQGEFTVTGDDSQALSGEEDTCAAGTATPAVAVPLTGESFTSAQQNMGAPGGASLTGASATVTAGDVFVTNDREFALTGVSMTAQDGLAFSSPLAFALGQELTISQENLGPREVTLTGESSTVEQGTLGPEDGRMADAGGHGKKGKKPRRPLTVEIDGETFSVNSREEALALLEQAKQTAEENAKLTVERAAAAEKRPTRKVLKDAREALQEPEIEASEDLAAEAEAVKAEIDAMYKDAMVKVEIAARLRREEDEDETALLMLIQ